MRHLHRRRPLRAVPYELCCLNRINHTKKLSARQRIDNADELLEPFLESVAKKEREIAIRKAAITCAIVLIIVDIAIAVTLFVKREAYVIQAASYPFCIMMCVGAVVANLFVIMLVQKPSDGFIVDKTPPVCEEGSDDDEAPADASKPSGTAQLAPSQEQKSKEARGCEDSYGERNLSRHLWVKCLDQESE
mgnify:CR=1 FL=1